MSSFNLPYQPVRQSLYKRSELFKHFDETNAASWGKTVDFRIYKHFLLEGGNAPVDPYMGMMQALHDNSITQLTKKFIGKRKVAAIMGSHSMARDDAAYRDVAILARRLTRKGILMCAGGGPGAMEATHLGASLALGDMSDLDKALSQLKAQPELPEHIEKIVDKGMVDPSLVAQAHAWFKPAHQIAAAIKRPSQSLAVPTWGCGSEPTTPFATHIAKYFQNSLREDGLLALAKQGIVYIRRQSWDNPGDFSRRCAELLQDLRVCQPDGIVWSGILDKNLSRCRCSSEAIPGCFWQAPDSDRRCQ